MESERPRAGDMGENYSEDKLEKIFNLVVGLDDKMSDIEKRVAKLEEDDTYVHSSFQEHKRNHS